MLSGDCAISARRGFGLGPVRMAALTLAALGATGPSARAHDLTRPISQFSHQAWQSEDGLPQNTIHAIVQTSDGYVWLATQEGLVRFDGVKFTVFDRTNTAELPTNHIQTLYVAKDGTLWIATLGGGLTGFNDGRFRLYTRQDGLSSDSVMAITEDGEGALWLATQGGGLDRFHAERFMTYTPGDGLGSLSVTSVAVDTNGIVWAGTTGGLSRFEQGRFTTFTARDGLADTSVATLAVAPDGSLWIGTTGGLTRLHNRQFTTFTTRDGLLHDVVLSLFVDDGGTLWIGTGRGVNRLHDGMFTALTSANGLTSENVTAIFEDREGSYWVGTNGGGLNRWREATFVTYGPSEGLADEMLYSVTGDPKHGVWLGSQHGRVFNFSADRFTAIKHGESVDGTSIRAIFRDEADTLWIGTDRDLYRYRAGALIAFGRSHGLPASAVRAVFQDRSGRLWAGTDGAGLGLLEGDRFRTFTTKDGLSGDRVRAFLQGRRGELWIGTYGGLTRFQDGRFVSYTTADGLSHEFVRSLYEDADGTLWIGTYGGGLNRFKDGRFTAYRERDGLVSDVVYSVLDDGQGYLWMTSNKGVSRVAKRDLDAFAEDRNRAIPVTWYNEDDGLRSRECNGGSPAGWDSGDGRLWFPTLKGLAMVEPARIRVNQTTPPVVLEQALSNGRPIEPGGVLPAGSDRFEFHYTGISFVGPEYLRFMYRLDGVDERWIDAGTRRAAYYTNLPPGRYRFVVIAANHDGFWNTAGASFEFTLEPHFYQTTLFYVACGLALVGLIAGYIQIHTRQVRARERKLRARVDEAVAQIRTLRGLLPICARCKNVRDDSGYWTQIEQYVHDHSEAEFSHGICPDCFKTLYPDHTDILDTIE